MTTVSCSPGVSGPHRWQCDPPHWAGECGIVHAVCSVCGDERDWPAAGELRKDVKPLGACKPRHPEETMPDFTVEERRHNPLRTPVRAEQPYRSMPTMPELGPLVGENRRVDGDLSGVPLPEPQTGLKQRKTKGEKVFSKHAELIDNDPAYWRCVCGKGFPTRRRVQAHILAHERYQEYYANFWEGEKKMPDTAGKKRAYIKRKPEIIAVFRECGTINATAHKLGIPMSTTRGLLVRWGEYVPGKDRVNGPTITEVLAGRPDWGKLPDGVSLPGAVLATPPPTAYLAALLEKLNGEMAQVETTGNKLSGDIAAVERVMALVGKQ